MHLLKVLSFLDSHQIRYQSCTLSPCYGVEDTAFIVSSYGMGWVETRLLEMDGSELAVAIIPDSLTIDQLELSQRFAPRKVRLLSHEEAEIRIPGGGHLPPFGCLFGAEVYISAQVERFQKIAFFVDNPKQYITLSATDFHRLLAVNSKLEVPTRLRYRAYASPRRKSLEHCILGISLENADFHTAKLITITSWIKNHFKSCSVMIGDSLHRITLQMDSQLPEFVALAHSQWLAQEFVHAHQSIFSKEGDVDFFKFEYCSNVQKNPMFSNYYREICGNYEQNLSFRNSFHLFSELFVGRRIVPPECKDAWEGMSRQYLMEELAIIACLAQERPRTFVYPGSLTILDEIASGKHLNIPNSLMMLDYVELKLKRH